MNGLKIACGKTGRVKVHKSDTKLTTVGAYFNGERFNVAVPTGWLDLLACTELKAPFVPRADNVGNKFLVTAW